MADRPDAAASEVVSAAPEVVRAARPLMVQLVLAGRPVLVVGGGRVATRKVAQLLDCQAAVLVVAPTVSDEIAAWERAGLLRVERRAFGADDLDAVDVVFSATGVPDVADDVARSARASRRWINSADDPANCDFLLAATFERGVVQVAVGTAGAAPGLAAYCRDRIDDATAPEWEELAAVVASCRADFRAGGLSTESLDWRSAPFGGMLEELQGGRSDRARELLELWLSSPSA